jgi:hypothetical protein
MVWEIDGIRGIAEKPDLAGTYSGPLLILGGGRCLWDDLYAVNDEKWKWDRMTVNDITAHYVGMVHHAVSLHHDYLIYWTKLRMGHGYGKGLKPKLHSYRDTSPDMSGQIDALWAGLESLGGSSGLFAVLVAICLGYDRIILAGMPMDGTGHYFDPPEGQYDGSWWVRFCDADVSLQQCWTQAREQFFHDKVRSLSGHTKRWLGGPEEDWLNWKLKR